MTSVSTTASQLTLHFEPSLPERFGSLRAYLAFRAATQAKPLKVVAAEMDLSPSALSRKLNPGEGDTARFTVDDLEAYLQATGDVGAVLEYLAAKYGDTDESRKARLLSQVEQMLPQLGTLLATLRGAA